MADADGELTVAQRLGRLLDRGLLPAGGPAEAAERLIERLERPARVALLGLPGSGKSAILNLLAGTVVVPETLRLPTIIVQHGNQPRMLCTLSDGRNEIIPGDNLEKSLSLSPALITLELDLPALKVISLLEIAAGPQEVDQRRAALWAGKRADILIWCTTSYLPKEQLVWEGMPDSFKDNGFLLLTKVDLLGGREAAAGMHHRVEQRAGGEFRQVLSISAKEARAATLPTGQVDRSRFLESGAGSVISTIKTRVQSARRADTDTAELILARQAGLGEETPRRSVEVAPPELVAVKAAAAFVPPPEVEKAPPAVVQAPAPPPEPVVVPVIEPLAAPVVEPVVVAEAEPETPVEPQALPVPEPVTPPEPEVIPDPAPLPEVVAQPVAAPEIVAEVDAAVETAPAIEPAMAAPEEPEVVPDTEAALPGEPEITADPAPEDSPRPAVGFLTSAGGQRLSDRIKQIRPSGPVAEPPLVPLRATWKSRTDAALPAAAEVPAEPVKTPRARPVDPANAGRPSLRVSPDKEAASPKREPQPEAAVEVSAEDRLKGLRQSDDVPIAVDTDVEAAVEMPAVEIPDLEETPDDVIAVDEPADVKEDAAEDPALARLSALRPPRPEAPVQWHSDEPEPEEEPEPEAEAEPAVEDPALARLSALRQPRSEPPAPARPGPPEVEKTPPAGSEKGDLVEARLAGLRVSRPDVSPRVRTERPQSSIPLPVEVVAKPPVDDAPPEVPVPAEPAPAEPVMATRPLPDHAPAEARGPWVPSDTAADATARRPLSSRLSQASGQPPVAPASPEAVPALGPRMPRSGVPGSPRVTVLRERRVEVQPVEHRGHVRIAPATGPAVPAPSEGPEKISAAEAGLLDTAIGMIVTRSAELLALIDPNAKLPVDLVLEHGCETTEQVIEVISKGNSAEMRRISGSLSELQDVIMLMQLEKGHAPADDTLTLLLQLRRELETLRTI